MLTDNEIVRQLAHHLWEAEGHPDGKALDHWLEAQRRATASDVETPWYDRTTTDDEIDWMRRTLWISQPYMRN